MGVNGWIRWLEARGLHEPGAEAHARSSWRGAGLLAFLWLAGVVLLATLLAVAG